MIKIIIFHLGCDCKDLVDPKDEGNCTGSINLHFGKVICYVEQPTSCSDARDSVEYAGEKYSALACTVGGKNAISRNSSITKILFPSLNLFSTS